MVTKDFKLIDDNEFHYFLQKGFQTKSIFNSTNLLLVV
jgi:hypothetical protein